MPLSKESRLLSNTSNESTKGETYWIEYTCWNIFDLFPTPQFSTELRMAHPPNRRVIYLQPLRMKIQLPRSNYVTRVSGYVYVIFFFTASPLFTEPHYRKIRFIFVSLFLYTPSTAIMAQVTHEKLFLKKIIFFFFDSAKRGKVPLNSLP